MFNGLALLALAFGLMPITQPQTPTKHTHGAQPTALAYSETKRLPLQKSPDTPSSQPLRNRNDEEAHPEVRIPETVSVSIGRDWIDYLVLALDLILLIVGVTGSAIALRSLNAIKRQADLMKQQSDLTLNERRAFLEIQAGRLSVDTLSPEIFHLRTFLSLRNLGYSRAFILKSHVNLHIGEVGEPIVEHKFWADFDLEIPDGFLDPETATHPVTPSVFHFPKGNVTLADLATKFYAQTPLDTTLIVLFGFIEYKTLGIRWRREFGYRWHSHFGFNSWTGGTEPTTDTDKLTSGNWAEDTDYLNDEYVISQPDEPPPF